LATNYLFNYFSVTPFCNTEPHGIRGVQPITHTWLLKLLFLKYPPLPAQQRLQTFRTSHPLGAGKKGTNLFNTGFRGARSRHSPHWPIPDKLPTLRIIRPRSQCPQT